MPQISVRVSPSLVRTLDAAARRQRRSRADLVRSALEYYLEDADDLRVALDRLQDPGDPALDWEAVKSELLGPDQE
jgi:transposase